MAAPFIQKREKIIEVPKPKTEQETKIKTTMTITCSVDKHNIVMATAQTKRKPKLWMIVHLSTEITSKYKKT